LALLGNESSHSLAVAINSCDIYLFPWQKKKIECDIELDKVELGVCCKRLKGHTDSVLCLASYKNLLISSSKVRSILFLLPLKCIALYIYISNFVFRITALEYGHIVM